MFYVVLDHWKSTVYDVVCAIFFIEEGHAITPCSQIQRALWFISWKHSTTVCEFVFDVWICTPYSLIFCMRPTSDPPKYAPGFPPDKSEPGKVETANLNAV